MAVVQPDYESAPRGKQDAARHREKIREAIRENLPDVIGNEAIITRKGRKLVRIPIRGVKSYHFKHGQSGGAGGGFGSGESQRGKVIGRRSKEERGTAGKPGEEPGTDFFETEVDIDELVEMMFEDLGLPNLRRKEIRETVIPRGWTFDSIERVGIRPRLDKKRSIKEAILRTEALVGALIRETGRDEDECRRALGAAEGDAEAALRMLESGLPIPPADSDATLDQRMAGEAIVLESDDLRYRTITDDVEYQSSAVVIAMMDVSGSMTTMKKYFARSFYFWMVSFLRNLYRHVEIRFIAHTTEAKLVDEYAFFHRGESGGTVCASAYELAAELVASEYPTSSWNVYPFHFSDGEDWDPKRTMDAVTSLLTKDVAALGYGEIQAEYSSSVLLQAYRHAVPLRATSTDGYEFYEGARGETPVIGVVVRSREDLYPALRAFLRPNVGAPRGVPT